MKTFKSTMRRICSKCNRKLYARNMYLYHYPLINRIAWHCEYCINSTIELSFLKLSPQGDKK